MSEVKTSQEKPGLGSEAGAGQGKALCPVLPEHLVFSQTLGKGAYGEVFLCTDSKDGSQVAVKTIRDFARDPLFGKRILREIRLLASKVSEYSAAVDTDRRMGDSSSLLRRPLTPGSANRPGTSGVAVGPEMAIGTPEGTMLPTGETGNIMVRGPPTMEGYEADGGKPNEKANAEVFKPGGWFDTGIARNLFGPTLSGGCLVCAPGFDPIMWWDIAETVGVTWYYASPTMHQMILQIGRASCRERV